MAKPFLENRQRNMIHYCLDAECMPEFMCMYFKCYEKFKENVWEVLKKEFENKIKSLNDNCNNLSKLESKFRDTINNIIDDYDSGHIIEGYCDVCNKIYHENDITKLRPKV